MNDDMPWVDLTQEEVQELRSKKQELTEYGKQKIRELMDYQASNGDFIKNYPDVTRVEVIGSNGREYVRYECSNVQVSLQDDGQTIKVFLFSTYD